MSKESRQRFLVAGLLLALGAVHACTLRPGHVWGDDFSQYIHHAKNLAERIPYGETGYIYHRDYATIGPPCYPPVCPLLLAPIYMLFGLNLEVMKLAMLACLVLFLWFVFLCFRRELPLKYAVAGVLLVGLNRHWLGQANVIGSDLPFMAILYLTFVVLQRACDTPPAEPPRLRCLLPAAFLMYLAYGARALGGVLLPSVLIHDFLRYRRITGSAVLVGAVFIALALGQSIALSSNTAYFDQYNVHASVFLENGLGYLKQGAGFWHNGYLAPLGALVFLAVSALAALGYLSSVRRHVTVLEVFPVLYLMAVLVFPGYAGARYLQPVFPLYLLFAFRGLEHPWLAQRIAPRRVVLVSLGVAVAGSYVAAATQLKLGATEGISKGESVALFRYVAAETDKNDVVVFIKPRVMSLLTSRRASAYHMPAHDPELWDYFDRIGATHLVVVENDDAMAGAEDPARLAYLRGFARRNAANLKPVFADADFSVYRIVGRGGQPSAPDATPAQGQQPATTPSRD